VIIAIVIVVAPAGIPARRRRRSKELLLLDRLLNNLNGLGDNSRGSRNMHKLRLRSHVLRRSNVLRRSYIALGLGLRTLARLARPLVAASIQHAGNQQCGKKVVRGRFGLFAVLLGCHEGRHECGIKNRILDKELAVHNGRSSRST
jgi:hypothetical protein